MVKWPWENLRRSPQPTPIIQQMPTGLTLILKCSQTLKSYDSKIFRIPAFRISTLGASSLSIAGFHWLSSFRTSTFRIDVWQLLLRIALNNSYFIVSLFNFILLLLLFESWSCYVAKARIKLEMLLPRLFKYWGYSTPTLHFSIDYIFTKKSQSWLLPGPLFKSPNWSTTKALTDQNEEKVNIFITTSFPCAKHGLEVGSNDL